MKLRFTKDYIGRETGMAERFAGEEVEIATAQALALIKLGVAEEVVDNSAIIESFEKLEKPEYSEKPEFPNKPRKGRAGK